MHLSTKRLTVLAMMLAITVLCVILSSVIETGTIFFLAAGSYLVGVAVLETNMAYGFALYIASILLSLILAPNKIYCLTFAAMGGYLLIMEMIKAGVKNHDLKKLATLNHSDVTLKSRKRQLWVCKFAVFNAIYLPILIFAPRLVYAGEIKTWMYFGLFLGGQIALLFYDIAYGEFIVKYWQRIRKKI